MGVAVSQAGWVIGHSGIELSEDKTVARNTTTNPLLMRTNFPLNGWRTCELRVVFSEVLNGHFVGFAPDIPEVLQKILANKLPGVQVADLGDTDWWGRRDCPVAIVYDMGGGTMTARDEETGDEIARL